MIPGINPAYIALQARSDFESARLRAFFSEVAAFLRRRPNWLISFRDVESQLPMISLSPNRRV